MTKANGFYVFLAIFYGIVLSQIPVDNFKDFRNYLYYADTSWSIFLTNLDIGFLRLIFNEPIWLLVNSFLAIFFEPEVVVRGIIFFGATSVAWLSLKNYPRKFFIILLVLLLPQVIKNYLIHVRQGLAVAVFLYGWFSCGRSRRLFLIGLTPFIHASFFFVVLLLSFSWIMSLVRMSPKLMTLAYFFGGVLILLSVRWVSEFLGARQADEYFLDGIGAGDGNSGLNFVFWLFILAIMFSAGKLWLRQHIFEIGIILFYLITYWTFEVSARIFESGLIVVLLAGLSLPARCRLIFSVAISGLFILAWVLRFSEPGFGFFAN